jgi:hypothetical protein
MTDTIEDVAAEAAGQEPVEPAIDEQSVAEQLVAQAGRRVPSWSARTGCSASSPSGCWRPRLRRR